jgi:hypothetical protein
MRRYTAREVQQAKAARETDRSARTSVKLYCCRDVEERRNELRDHATGPDILNADAIFGRSVTAMRGNTKKHSLTPGNNVLSPATAQVQQILSVDIMFVKKVTFAIGVLSPLGLTLVKHIRDRTTGVILDSLRSFVSTARSRNF